MTYTLLVCGGRSFADDRLLETALDALVARLGAPALVVAGGAAGADTLAIRWAARRKFKRRVEPADWAAHGKAAGPIRNQKMLDLYRPGVVVAFPGGVGTADMVRRSRLAGAEVILIGA